MVQRTIRSALLIAVIAFAATPQLWALQVTDGPTLTMNPNGVTPLAGVIRLTADVPVRVGLTVSDGSETWGVEFPDLQAQHAVPLLGLKPNNVYTIAVTATDAAGNRAVLSPNLMARTDPLPADFPIISVYYNERPRTEPGFTLLDRLRRFGTTGIPYQIIVDDKGDVRWYSTLGSQDGTRQLSNGRLLLLDSSELDLLGNRYILRAFDVPGMFLHHDLYPTEHGTFLSLSIERVTVADFPTSEVDPSAPRQTATIYSDIVTEFGQDGSLVNSWHLTDLIDPRRIAYDATRPGFPLFDLPDWSHSNAVTYDPRDDSIIVSVRHQDAVVKFSRSTGRLIWILGPHDNWAPEFQPYLLTPVGAPFEWQFHQHSPKITSRGTLLLFDNGNYRASPFDGRTPVPDAANYSRAVEYAIDETTMQVRQVWESGGALGWPTFSPTQGDADLMPLTGNVLITLSDTRYMGGASGVHWGLALSHTAIIEVTHDTPAQKVLDMRIYDLAPGSTTHAYRSERIKSLYAADVRIISDSDQDGLLDNQDNCTNVTNANQRDTDNDGYGNICDPDLNNDGLVEYVDLYYLSVLFYSTNRDADLDGDGVVSWSDLDIMYRMFFGRPGPSGLVPAAP